MNISLVAQAQEYAGRADDAGRLARAVLELFAVRPAPDLVQQLRDLAETWGNIGAPLKALLLEAANALALEYAARGDDIRRMGSRIATLERELVEARRDHHKDRDEWTAACFEERARAEAAEARVAAVAKLARWVPKLRTLFHSEAESRRLWRTDHGNGSQLDQVMLLAYEIEQALATPAQASGTLCPGCEQSRELQEHTGVPVPGLCDECFKEWRVQQQEGECW